MCHVALLTSLVTSLLLAGVELLPYSEVLAKGRTSKTAHSPPSAKDTATIMYTSGTTVRGKMTSQLRSGSKIRFLVA